ncbi:MAG: hypothetical protein ACRC1J_03670, partial [Sandaracinobacteroides sp.]
MSAPLLPPTGFRPADVQGNILRGYHYSRVRHLVLEVRDPAAARRWLGATVSESPQAPSITSEVQWKVKPPTAFNIG